MAKFPYLTSRRGTKSLYYKRLVPLELRAAGRHGQVWRSLRTSDRKKAEAAYGATHEEVEALFARWRQDDAEPHPCSPRASTILRALLRPRGFLTQDWPPGPSAPRPFSLPPRLTSAPRAPPRFQNPGPQRPPKSVHLSNLSDFKDKPATSCEAAGCISTNGHQCLI